MFKCLPVGVMLTVLAGCQTNYTYVRTGEGPNLDVSLAQCDIMSMGVGSSMVAWGTPGYVAGAQLSHAIATDIQRDQFIKQCMVIKGWTRVQAGKKIASDEEVQAMRADIERAKKAAAKIKPEKQHFPPPPKPYGL